MNIINLLMATETTPLSRKRFLRWGLGITSLLTIPAFLRTSGKKKETKTVKMLTQDGKLVTVDVSALPQKKRKIDPDEIHTWVATK